MPLRMSTNSGCAYLSLHVYVWQGRGGVDGADVERDGGFADGLVGFGVLRQRDQNAIGAQDAGLFARDLGDGVAELFRVIERDVGDDGEDRLDDIGGVEAAAKADFEHGDIDLGSGKVQEGHGGDGLEEAGRSGQAAFGDELFRCVDDGFEVAAEVVVGDEGVCNLVGCVRRCA